MTLQQFIKHTITEADILNLQGHKSFPKFVYRAIDEKELARIKETAVLSTPLELDKGIAFHNDIDSLLPNQVVLKAKFQHGLFLSPKLGRSEWILATDIPITNLDVYQNDQWHRLKNDSKLLG